MSINMQKIANQLNVSISTVSRVVNNKPNVNENTRKMVLDYLAEKDIVIDEIAGGAGKTGDLVAVIIPDITETYFAHVIRGIENALAKRDNLMMLCETMENAEKEQKYIKNVTKRKFKGIILATVNDNPDQVERLIRGGTNIVFFDNLPRTGIACNAVLTDNIRAGAMAVEHLVDLGHRRIGIIAGRETETTGFERLIGYRRAMQQHGLAADDSLVACGNYKEDSGFNCMERLLDRNPDITAVFVCSSQMTYGAVKAIESRGLKIPDDISVVGFDIHDSAGLAKPGITTVLQDEANIGAICVDMVFRQQNAGKTAAMPSQKILLEPKLIVRGSCSAPG